jgi:undecaprenyl-diphosphatase
VNNGMQNAFLDWLCPLLRKQGNWYLLYAVLVFFLYRKHQKNTIWIVVGAALMILITDQLSAHLIKNIVQRLRPCNDPALQSQVHLLVHCGQGFSFVSSHATNHFALAIFVPAFFPDQGKWLLPVALLWAGSIAFSQVYVGVHYPFDVICGALLGSIIAYIAALIVRKKTEQSP